MSAVADPDTDNRPDLHPSPTIQAETGTSLLTALQRKRQELAQRGPKEDIRLVPAWEGALRIRYRYPEGGADPIIRAVERAAEAASRSKDNGKRDHVRDANADVLVACCYDIEFREPGGDWQPLDENGPTRFTDKLAGKLGIEMPERIKSRARFLVRNVFSPAAASTGEYEGDVALMTQAGQVLDWLRGVDVNVDEALQGE